MDSSYRKLLICTLISSLIVVVGIGHGAVPIIFTELIMFKNLKFQFSFNEEPEAVVTTSSLIFLVGQIFWLFYLAKKKWVLFWLGFAILWFGFIVLIRGEGGVMLFFGLPFAILSYILVARSIMSIRTRYGEDAER